MILEELSKRAVNISTIEDPVEKKPAQGESDAGEQSGGTDILRRGFARAIAAGPGYHHGR